MAPLMSSRQILEKHTILDGLLEMDFSSYLISEALNFNARLLYEIYSHKVNQQ